MLSRNIEGVLHDIIDTRMKMPLQSIEQMYAAIEVNIPDEYVYNENTTIFVMDSVNEVCDLYNLTPEQTERINNEHSLTRGTTIHQMYRTKI